MNTTPESRLLELYDRVAEAPDAIERLRKFVLDLAVRGKLVEQNPEDEPAEELLERIAAERARLVKTGKIKKSKPSEPIDSSALPIEVPDHWAFIRLCDIGVLSGGMTPSKHRPEFWDGDVVWLSPKDIKDDEAVDSALKITQKGLTETRLELFPVGSLFIVARSGILKRTFPVAINRVPAASNQDLKVLVPFLKGQERYLQIMFRGMTDFVLSELVKTGTTVQSLKYAEFAIQPFPLPPLPEQHRIVAKVDELMALLDRLETTRTQRDATRDRLTTASLTRLTAPETTKKDFPSHARFALENIDQLTSRPDQIKVLRQTILNLAVRGKLVEQDPGDEPAAELLNRIANERSRLVKAGQIKKQKSSPPVDLEPFAIPASWEWLPLTELGATQTGSTPPKSMPDYYGSDVPFIRPGDLYPNRVDYSGDGLSDAGAETSGRLAPSGSILMVCIGTVGKCQVVDRTVSFNQQINTLTPFAEVAPQFVLLALQSKFFQELAWAASAKTTIAILNKGNWEKLPIPLPPLAEQHRIVAKVDTLIKLCDKQEAALTTADTTKARLLEVRLHDSLAQDAHNREAA